MLAPLSISLHVTHKTALPLHTLLFNIRSLICGQAYFTRMRRAHIIQIQHRMSRDVLERFDLAMSIHTLLKIYGATSVSVLGIDTLAANQYGASLGELR